MNVTSQRVPTLINRCLCMRETEKGHERDFMKRLRECEVIN